MRVSPSLEVGLSFGARRAVDVRALDGRTSCQKVMVTVAMQTEATNGTQSNR